MENQFSVNTQNPQISHLRVYPIKSLDPLLATEFEVGIRSLKDDRMFAIIDEDGRYINGKRTGRVNQLKAIYDLPNHLVYLSERADDERGQAFELRQGNAKLNEYLSDFFQIKSSLIHSNKGEFMDIPGASSVTLVSEASLRSLQSDFPGHSLEDMRLRFRSNIELKGVEAFWEEQLFQSPGIGMRFSIGDVEMIGVSPRARCNVPPQDPLTGELDRSFVRQMIESRNNSLPKNSRILEFGRTTYFLTVNVYLAETELGKKIKLGDAVNLIGAVNLEAV